MKKLIVVFAVFFIAVSVAHSQEPTLTLSGEFKTGLLYYDKLSLGDFPPPPKAVALVANSEDADWTDTKNPDALTPGRFRLNFQVSAGNIGTKFRFETTKWPKLTSTSTVKPELVWGYAFAYGYFWDRQIKVSAGKMGDSPWGSGGPEMWKELDTTIGLRFELIPSFIPFIAPGSLNFGFVLNSFNAGVDGAIQWGINSSSFLDILQESVFGISYTHEYFLARFAYRLDNVGDEDVGDKMLYRLEERIIKKYLPGFQVFANGWVEGINGKDFDPDTGEKKKAPDYFQTQNWVYVQYTPDMLTAQLRFGYNYYREQSVFYVRAGFYYNLFNKLLVPGIAFEYAQDFGPNKLGSDAYLRWYIEPQIRLNFASGTYIALVYRYQDDYHTQNSALNGQANSRINWVNLRATFTF